MQVLAMDKKESDRSKRHGRKYMGKPRNEKLQPEKKCQYCERYFRSHSPYIRTCHSCKDLVSWKEGWLFGMVVFGASALMGCVSTSIWLVG